MTEYVQEKKVTNIPRIPLEGSIDLTYRCNNNCRHCWLRIPANSHEKENELTFDEIRKIVDEARKMGCRVWRISGGEPMLRPDFVDIFDYITSKSASYSINTNGTLITSKIAKLLKKKGSKMVALYGATAEVHDHITRTPGSFEATMQGFAYLKEAGTGFTVQLIPMRDNFHQYKEMVELAESLSSLWRIGAGWLYLSANGKSNRNREIIHQRLDPVEAVLLDRPNMHMREQSIKQKAMKRSQLMRNEYFFASCIDNRRAFHIDPYGKMTFCSFVKDPSMRYDLKTGFFSQGWNDFIPSLAEKIRTGTEYRENCGTCELRAHCRWCAVYGYLENRKYQSKVDYLCDLARETKKYKEKWRGKFRRYFEIADLTIQLNSDLPITDATYHPKFKPFQTDGPGEETISVSHHFSLPELEGKDLGDQVYQKPPWVINKKGNSWIYRAFVGTGREEHLHSVSIFNHDYSGAKIYNKNDNNFQRGGLLSLTSFPTDQIFLAQTLANRKGCIFHSSGIIFNGNGLLFLGHSGAGKSSIVKMLKGKAIILCDDRIIVRRRTKGFKIYGNWSHGEVPDISADSSPLKAIMFLEQSKENSLLSFDNKKEIISKLMSCVIKPFVTAEWWHKTISILEHIAREVPCYSLHFDKNGGVAAIIEQSFGANSDNKS